MDEPQLTPSNSVFVNVVAWISIVINSMALLAAVVLGSFFYMFFSTIDQEQSLDRLPNSEPIFAIPEFILGFSEVLLGIILLFAVVPLASSIGLLLRKNWARLLFIVMLGINILYTIIGIAVQLFMHGEFPFFPENAPGMGHEIERMFDTISFVSTAFSIFIAGLYGWIIWKLSTPPIIYEFKTLD